MMSKLLSGVDVTEIYSPALVAQVCSKYCLQGRSSMDLSNGWDFDLLDQRLQAEARVINEKPFASIGSPPCTLLSTRMAWNLGMHGNDPAWKKKYDLAVGKAKRHVRF